MKLVIYTDGGSRGNPGLAASAYWVSNEAGIMLEKCGKCIGVETNNVAEYRALLLAWEWLDQEKSKLNNLDEVSFKLDSELVVKQIRRIYKVKDHNLSKLWEEVVDRQARFEVTNPAVKITYTHIPREQNKEADRLVNEAMDAHVF